MKKPDKKLVINGVEVQPVPKKKLQEDMSLSEIEKLIRDKQRELGLIKDE
jgi:hypothetical protein